jgi:hypothetical protein
MLWCSEKCLAEWAVQNERNSFHQDLVSEVEEEYEVVWNDD